MPIMKDIKIFDQMKNKVQEQNTKRSGGFNDERFIKFEPGNTYRFRLLYYTDDSSDRELPFISKYTHFVKDETDNKWKGVTCPTTKFPKTGFDKCPLCTNNSKLWSSGLDSDKELYKKFRRKFNGYALVYVVHDPLTSDNNGTVKIMRFGVMIDRWLKKEIFGASSGRDDEAEDVMSDPIGSLAFATEDGHDLIVECTKKGDWNEYACKFARSATTIEIDDDDLEAQCKELNFDSEHKVSTEQELQDFFNKHVLDTCGEEADVTIEDEPEAASNEDVQNLIADLNEDDEEESVAPKATTKKAPAKKKPAAKKAEATPEPDSSDDGDDTLADINALINEL
jgi:hypothetical protein